MVGNIFVECCPQFVACFALAALFNNSLKMTGWLASRSELVMTFGALGKLEGAGLKLKYLTCMVCL